MILSRFRWYRRMRGGYWAQVTAPLGLFSKVRWVRCPEMRPTPDRKWEFYPSAVREASPVTAYVDEWHCIEPCWAVPFSHHLLDTLGTNDPGDFVKLVQAARMARRQLGRWPLAGAGSSAIPAMDALDAALAPFALGNPAQASARRCAQKVEQTAAPPTAGENPAFPEK